MALAALPFPVAEARAAPAPRPLSRRFYLPELDLLRLLAFLMVWFAHASFAFHGLLPARGLALVNAAGSLGAPIFFFLSAYLITELLRRERQLTGAVHLPLFYMRRILRIWPLYFAILAAYGLLGLRFHGFRIEPGRLLASFLLAGNWYIAFHPAITTPLRALWSISVEEQWYVLWPLLARTFSRARLLLFCGLFFFAAQGILVLLAHGRGQAALSVTGWVNSGVQFQYLALGAAAALLLNGRVPRLGASMRVLLVASGAIALLAAAGVCQIKQAGVAHSAGSLCAGYMLAGLGTACLFFALLGISSSYCPRALVRLGQLSFGLYVFHETGFFLASALARHYGVPATLATAAGEKSLALALTVLLAFLSYHAWELPFLRLKQRWTIVRSREAA